MIACVLGAPTKASVRLRGGRFQVCDGDRVQEHESQSSRPSLPFSSYWSSLRGHSVLPSARYRCRRAVGRRLKARDGLLTSQTLLGSVISCFHNLNAKGQARLSSYFASICRSGRLCSLSLQQRLVEGCKEVAWGVPKPRKIG